MCKKWFDSVSKYCAVQENDEIDGKRNNVKCKYCNIDQFSMNKDVASTHGVCVENDLLSYYTSALLIPNCISLTWDNTNSVYTCNKCNAGYYLLDYNGNANDKKKCYSFKECTDLYDVANTIYPYAIEQFKGDPAATYTINFATNMRNTCLVKTANTYDSIESGSKCKIRSSSSQPGLTGGNAFKYYCHECPSDKPLSILL